MKKKIKEWWSLRSPITKEHFQIRHFPATNWKFLNDVQIEHIYNKEKINEENLKTKLYANYNNKP